MMGPQSEISSIKRGTQPLRWWTEAQLQHLEHQVALLLRTWQQAWGVSTTSEPGRDVHAKLAWQVPDAAQASWHAVDGNRPGVWWASTLHPDAASNPHSSSVLHALGQALFALPTGDACSGPSHDVSDLLPDIARKAWDDLCHQLYLLLDARSPWSKDEDLASTPTSRLRPWSGSVVITLPWLHGHDLQWLVEGPLMERVTKAAHARGERPSAPELPPLHPLWDAIAGLPCLVRVELHATQISLGDIQDIQVGDVFDVPHALDEPLLAVSEHGIPIAQAYLGKSQSHKAIELLDQPLAPHSASTP